MLKLNLQLFAHKKGMGSTKNGRDSESKRLGAKKGDGQSVIAGNILVRQMNIVKISGDCIQYSIRLMIVFRAEWIMLRKRLAILSKSIDIVC